MEFLLEKFFGPNGYFPEERVNNLLQARKKSSPVDKVHNKVRDAQTTTWSSG